MAAPPSSENLEAELQEAGWGAADKTVLAGMPGKTWNKRNPTTEYKNSAI